MNFSSGQISFMLFFVVVFVTAMIYAYRKDLKLQKNYFQGSLTLLFSIFGILIAIFGAVKLLS
jgi:hypothetical protein